MCQYHYIPIYKFSIYNKFNKKYKKSNFKGSELFYKNAISLPIHVNLNNYQQNYVISSITSLIKKYKND